MNENLTPYPADDSLQRAKAETDELLRELDKLRQASKQECQQLYFQAIWGKSVLPANLISNEYDRGYFDGYVAGKFEAIRFRDDEGEMRNDAQKCGEWAYMQPEGGYYCTNCGGYIREFVGRFPAFCESCGSENEVKT